jgi:hypothetical protein
MFASIGTLSAAVGVFLLTCFSTVFMATFKAVCVFLSTNASIIPPFITALGVIWAVMYPLARNAKDKGTDRNALERSIGLYLDVLAAKVDEIVSNEARRVKAITEMHKKYPNLDSIYYTDHEFEFPDLRLPYSGKGKYELENHANHDILENLYVKARSLSSKQKDGVSKFIQYYKRSKQMESVADFKSYRKQLALAAIQFPSTTSLNTRNAS